MTADLSALIARLEAAEVGSRELDAEICILFQYGGPNSEGAVNVRTDSNWEGDLLFEQGGDECCNPIPPVTTSLDAALALAARVLPGWSCSAIKGQGGCEAYVWPHAEAFADVQGKSSTPALAICIAILRAKQGEGS